MINKNNQPRPAIVCNLASPEELQLAYQRLMRFDVTDGHAEMKGMITKLLFTLLNDPERDSIGELKDTFFYLERLYYFFDELDVPIGD